MPFLALLGTVLTRVLSLVLTTVAGQIITALGLSLVTYKGADVLQQQFVSLLHNHIGGLPAEALQLLYLAGFGVALNWILGATSFALGLMAVSKLGTAFKG